MRLPSEIMADRTSHKKTLKHKLTRLPKPITIVAPCLSTRGKGPIGIKEFTEEASRENVPA
jgi:hypothetical protein